jgi:8-oxo-dGTP pyrophosphatase MutT (NUDIX family)
VIVTLDIVERLGELREQPCLCRPRRRAVGEPREKLTAHEVPDSTSLRARRIMKIMADASTRPVVQVSAGGLVVDEHRNVLLIRARDLRNRPVWTLPKGALNEGESAEAAALREVREETGYRCEVVRELEPVTYWFQREGRRIRKTVHWYLMRPLDKVGEHDHEVDEVRWTGPDEADGLLRYDSDRRLLSLVRSA